METQLLSVMQGKFLTGPGLAGQDPTDSQQVDLSWHSSCSVLWCETQSNVKILRACAQGRKKQRGGRAVQSCKAYRNHTKDL